MNKLRVYNIKDLIEIVKNINEDGPFNIELQENCDFYAISESDYELLLNVKDFLDNDNKLTNQKVKIISNNFENELSFEQYESLKKQINDALEKTLKPKAEKLN